MRDGGNGTDDDTWTTGVRTLSVTLLVTVLMGAALLAWVAFGRPVPGLAKEPTFSNGTALTGKAKARGFDGGRAFALLRRQVEVYGSRPAGSDASRRLGDELVQKLPNGTFEPVPGGLRNIVGTLPGKGAPLVIGAHYDTEASIPGHVGANDGAAGTAAVVELARSLKGVDRGKNAPPLRFVLFDGEEEPAGTAPEDFEKVALRGSKVEAARNPKAQAMILLDYIAERRGLSIPREGNSDRAMWGRLRTAAAKVGAAKVFPSAKGPTIIDDHIPFVRRGIPSIDLIDFDYPQRDTLQDDMDHVSEASLDAVGETVVQLLRRW
ncbi:MAG: M28 family metallopeptidase [Solirubrobacteraceae bacterium]|nr:M28 family metallopeptidase [Solirubrobacteraceae bacterium]